MYMVINFYTFGLYICSCQQNNFWINDIYIIPITINTCKFGNLFKPIIIDIIITYTTVILLFNCSLRANPLARSPGQVKQDLEFWTSENSERICLNK
jgi:hypothetical protein